MNISVEKETYNCLTADEIYVFCWYLISYLSAEKSEAFSKALTFDLKYDIVDEIMKCKANPGERLHLSNHILIQDEYNYAITEFLNAEYEVRNEEKNGWTGTYYARMYKILLDRIESSKMFPDLKYCIKSIYKLYLSKMREQDRKIFIIGD